MRWTRSKTAFTVLMVFLVLFAGFIGSLVMKPVADRPDLPQPGAISETSGIDSRLPTEGAPPPGGYEQKDYNALRLLFVVAMIGFAGAGWYVSQRRQHA